jgi:heat shock protein HslJ
MTLIAIASLVLAGCTSPKAESVRLDGTSWVLESLKGQAVSSSTDSQITMQFAGDTISGSDGCNSYSSTYTLKGSEFSVGKDIISTLMACADPVMQQAGAFTTALKQAASVEIDGDQLMLLDASGGTLATFKK